MFVEIAIIGVALDALFGDVAVRHGVADGGDFVAHIAEDEGDAARCLGFAASRADGANRHNRLRGLDLGWRGAEQTEVCAQSIDLRSLVHDVFVRHIRIGKNDFFYIQILDELHKLCFIVDGDAFGIKLTREKGRIDAPFDIGNLGSSEGDNLVILVTTKNGVEVVEVASCGSHDKYSFLLHFTTPFIF